MIIPPGPLKVLVAVKPVDFRNYAASMIMRSRWRRRAGFSVFTALSTPHNRALSSCEHRDQLVRRSEFPGLMPSGARAPSISSFSAGSARR